MKDSLRETMNTLRKRQTDDENIVRFSLPLLLPMGLSIPSALAKKLSLISSSTSKRRRRNDRGVFKNLRNRLVNSRKFWNHLSKPRTKRHLTLSWCVQLQTTRKPATENSRRPMRVRNMRSSRLSCPRWSIRGGKIMTPKPPSGASTKVTNESTLISNESTFFSPGGKASATRQRGPREASEPEAQGSGLCRHCRLAEGKPAAVSSPDFRARLFVDHSQGSTVYKRGRRADQPR